MSTPTPLPAWTSSSATPSHVRLPARGVGPTGGRGAAGIDPEDNQDHPEDITSCLDDSSGHAPSSRLDLGSGRGGAVTPLSSTSCPDTTSGTSCLDPEDNQDHHEDITSRLDGSSGHDTSSRLD